jgi:hypothetical protein
MPQLTRAEISVALRQIVKQEKQFAHIINHSCLKRNKRAYYMLKRKLHVMFFMFLQPQFLISNTVSSNPIRLNALAWVIRMENNIVEQQPRQAASYEQAFQRA